MLRNQSRNTEHYRDGEVIVPEGDTSRVMFVVLEGGAVVTKKAAGRDIVLATLGRGAFFGEMSLLESLPRSATVRALGDTRVLVINPAGLLLKIRRDPTFAVEMLQQLSRRLRRMDEALAALIETRPAAFEEAEEADIVGHLPEHPVSDAGALAENPQ